MEQKFYICKHQRETNESFYELVTYILNEPAVSIVTKNVSESDTPIVTYMLNEPDTPIVIKNESESDILIVTKDESESYNSRVPCVENELKY